MTVRTCCVAFSLATLGIVGASSSHAQQAAWTTTASSEVRYFSSRNNFGATGSQFYAPFGVQLAGRPDPDWSAGFLVRSGYIWSRQSSGGVSSNVKLLTDTNVTPTLSYFGWNGISPTLSVPMNLPTSTFRANSTVSESRAKIDGDFIPAPSFGEGFNIGPTLSNNLNINESTVLGVGVGYTNRGSFNQPTQTGTARFNPGDVTTFNGTLGYRGDQLSLQGSLSYSVETTTYQDGMPLYRAGDRMTIGGDIGYALTTNWSARLAANHSLSSSNEVQAGGLPVLVREAFNSNSNVTQANFELTYREDRYSLGPTVTYLYRDRNGYNSTTFQFLPAKTSWGAGVNGSYQFTDSFSLNASAQRIWVRENENPQKLDAFNAVIPGSGVPQGSTNIWVASISGSYKF